MVGRLAADGIHIAEWANAGLSGTTVATSSNPALSTWTGNQMNGRLPARFQFMPERVEVVTLNWGVNEMATMPDSATWIAEYSSIVTYVHGRFPNAKIFISYPWAVGRDSEAATMHGWIDTVIAAHSAYTFPGVDEAVTIKADDNGFLETDASTGGSGVHYTALGADYYARDLKIAIAAHFP